MSRDRLEPRKLPGRASRISVADRTRAEIIARRLARYFADRGRDFPWRLTADHYAVAIAEVLLTKTRAETVVPTWQDLIHRYPTPSALAAANATEVESSVRGLGLSIKRTARLISVAGFLARDGMEALLRLERARLIPGLGEYGSSAVACFLGGQHVGIVDANVRRVLTRTFSVRHPATQRGNARRIAALADLVASSAMDPRATNYGILDLAAAICRPRPRCEVCPLRDCCKYGMTRYPRP